MFWADLTPVSLRQEMATVSTFLSVSIVIYNLICMAFFTLKTKAQVSSPGRACH
jgi:hypothetical protein